MPDGPETIYTIGHSNHALDRFLRLLQVHGIHRVVDVRSFPRSKRNPQFDSGPLRDSLERLGLGYEHLPALGGMRRARPDSGNLALPAGGLRGYADHMETQEFSGAAELLRMMARAQPTVVMCAEASWRQCHRSLLSDALHARGVAVLHIATEEPPERHALTDHARVEGGRVRYPGDQRSLF